MIARKLKIAQIAPLAERVPPEKYGGTERVVFALCEELVLRGHEVTLFASGDSKTSAKLVWVYPRSLREAKIPDPYGTNEMTMLNFGLAYLRQNEFDIIHDHCGHLSLPTANLSNRPVVMTMHGPFTLFNRGLFEQLNKVKIVTVSQSQANSAPSINHLGTIYHGLSMASYPFGKKDNGYLLFVGRISMEKGVHLAIEVAQYLNLPLIIAAKLDSIDLPYFNQYVGPKLSDDLIKWVGEVDERERNKLMSKALCFLHPVTWEEPFGLTMIEAMACGCPVIGFNKGSVSEVVANGRTGFVVDDVNEMIEAVKNISMIKREECRKHALSNFNAERMADDYEEVYYKVLEEDNLKASKVAAGFDDTVFTSQPVFFQSPGQQKFNIES